MKQRFDKNGGKSSFKLYEIEFYINGKLHNSSVGHTNHTKKDFLKNMKTKVKITIT